MLSTATQSSRGLVERARALAIDARVSPGTLHLLAAALTIPSVLSRALRSQGVRAANLRPLSETVVEARDVLSQVVARARSTGAAVTDERVFLTALRDPRSAMSQLLRANGYDPEKLARVVEETEPIRRENRAQSVENASRTSGVRSASRGVASAQPVGPNPARPVSQGSPGSPLSPLSPVNPGSPGATRPKVKLSPRDAQRVSSSPAALMEPTGDSASETGRKIKALRGRDTQALDPKAHRSLSAMVLQTTGKEREVIGRDVELSRLRDAMGRAHARGALLVGAMGSGRTVLVEALAGRVDRPVVKFDHAKLMAELRAGPPERVRNLCDELGKARGGYVLVLDPVAPWFTARETPDELVIELRAALQSGSVAWVGVATGEEARRLAECEPWIERAALKVELAELAGDTLARVVDDGAKSLSARHGLPLSEDTATRALALSERYLGGRAQPDRALGVIDLALARARRESRTEVDTKLVSAVVAELAGLSVERVAATDNERLLKLEEEIAKRVVGHSKAIARVAQVVRRNAVGFRGARPVGTFLFLGPTGVGKTETAKALAEALFPGVNAMTRFDMAEFNEAHTVARLVGAPPGYVGYADGGQLTEAVRRRPYQLILLDEIEKAHRDVLEALLGLLDEARLTDGRGRTVDFRNTVVVMTSNLGAELYREGDRSISRARAIGFGLPAVDALPEGDPLAESVLSLARASLAPEVWNRIDEPLVFGSLARGEVAEIARRMLAGSAARLEAEQGVTVDVRESVIDLLLSSGGWEPSLGARPMRRTVARCVEAPLAEAVLKHELRRGDRVALGVVDGLVTIER